MPYIQNLETIEEEVKEILEEIIEKAIEYMPEDIPEEIEEVIIPDIKYYRSEYLKISYQKIKNAIQMEKILSEKDIIDGQLENIANIINEFQRQKYGKMHINYLEQFCDI